MNGVALPFKKTSVPAKGSKGSSKSPIIIGLSTLSGPIPLTKIYCVPVLSAETI